MLRGTPWTHGEGVLEDQGRPLEERTLDLGNGSHHYLKPWGEMKPVDCFKVTWGLWTATHCGNGQDAGPGQGQAVEAGVK